MAEENINQNSVRATGDVVVNVADKINAAENVLVALSKSPNVDELSAAIGLALALDKLGKHATAIFSGEVPNVIEFLDPQKVIEVNTNSLQDFIIALNKEKADHLRYKIDGDFVKVFITPYKTTIEQSDLEFSHGDYNVDLVVSINVESVGDLDGALAEHGRIMHSASAINISAGPGGRFGDIEWNDPSASSVSEMITHLAGALGNRSGLLDKSIATALLTGIVAATNRFSNAKTSPETMGVAAQLMSAGADQLLISANIPVDMLVPAQQAAEGQTTEPEPPKDPTKFAIDHDASEELEEAIAPTPDQVESGPLMEELKHASEEAEVKTEEQNEAQSGAQSEEAAVSTEGLTVPAPDEVEPLPPPPDYQSIMEQELAEPVADANPAAASAPEAPSEPEANSIPQMDYVADTSSEHSMAEAPTMQDEYLVARRENIVSPTGSVGVDTQGEPVDNKLAVEGAQADAAVAEVEASPIAEESPIPESVVPEPVTTVPMPSVGDLPPPPPPFDPNSGAVDYNPPAALPEIDPIQPAVLTSAPELPDLDSLGDQPVMQDQIYPHSANDPASFKIPSM
jgi:hypothetical protein